MNRYLSIMAGAIATVALASCGGDTQSAALNTSTTNGTLIYTPPLRIASVTAADFAAELSATSSGASLLQLAGTPTCGVDFYYIDYQTKGGAGEAATASGALMVPTGTAAACSGARPIVLYAHGTTTDKNYNIADITNTANTEGALVGAVFAAQGYVVIAPNYAGYDSSSLAYHPYLNASQQSGEMIDALTAGRAALPSLPNAKVTDNGKLFLSGYSQGGYVAVATMRALQTSGKTVTAAAPASGPYALEAFGDAIFYGQVNVGSTLFTPLLVTSYQKAYGNIYSALTDVYSATYATGIDTLLPNVTPYATLFQQGKLPQTALFSSTTPVTASPTLNAALAVPANPLFASGFGTSFLVNNSYRVAYASDAAANPDGALPVPASGVPLAATTPTQPLRKAFWTNDLRNGSWRPSAPVLMCGGGQDPTVFYSVNTGTMQAFWASLPTGLVRALDVNATPAGTFAQIQGAFQQSQAQTLAFLQTPAGGGLSAAAAQQQMVASYHGAVAPFCTLAARSYFAAF
jgi:hypothetical protein